eukprot:2386918-Prymnesium_polylepis.2
MPYQGGAAAELPYWGGAMRAGVPRSGVLPRTGVPAHQGCRAGVLRARRGFRAGGSARGDPHRGERSRGGVRLRTALGPSVAPPSPHQTSRVRIAPAESHLQ